MGISIFFVSKHFRLFRAIKILFILFILSGVFFAVKNDALADMAPPEPAAGSSLAPGEITQVRMLSEFVLIDIAGFSPYPAGHAIVTAQFTMRNLGEQTKRMRARFPMNVPGFALEITASGANTSSEEVCAYNAAPSLEDFRVWVDGDEVPAEINRETMIDYLRSPDADGNPVYVTVTCWSHFWVDFPPETDVDVTIRYLAPGYGHLSASRDGSMGGEVEFYYVLQTGAGWNGTIGRADIVARLPYEANGLNIAGCLPENCSVSGTDIAWHFEDFEPQENIHLRLLRPSLWMQILQERENIENNPGDGEAWGRLAKAYKDSLRGGKNFIYVYEPRHEEIFALSRAAYQKALELLPEDADWHYGYADLLCHVDVIWGDSLDELLACVRALEKILALEPSHEGGRDLLDQLVGKKLWGLYPVLSMEDGLPNYLILTPGPRPSPTGLPTATPTENRVGAMPQPAPTRGPENTPTLAPTGSNLESISATATGAGAPPAAVEPTTPAIPPEPEEDVGITPALLLGAGLGLVVVIFAAAAKIRRR